MRIWNKAMHESKPALRQGISDLNIKKPANNNQRTENSKGGKRMQAALNNTNSDGIIKCSSI